MTRLGRFVIAAANRFYVDQCLVWASSLAYASLLSMVPLLALMFAVLKGLGVQQRLESLLLSRLSLSAEVTETIVGYVDHINVGTLGGIGAAFLLVTVISVLGGIESSFNHIWRVARNRTPWRKVTDYLSVVLLTPFLLLAAVAVTSSMQADRVMEWVLSARWIGPLTVELLGLVPVLFNVVALGVLYAVMPNRRGSAPAVIVGALVAGIAWHLVQLAYIQFQIGVANYSAIYGALAQLPITLAWLYVSWAIVLFGAEIAALYEFGWEHLRQDALQSDPAAVALHLLVRAAEGFRKGGPPIEVVSTARTLGIAPEVVSRAMSFLVERECLVQVEERQRFILAMDPARIRLGILDEMRPRGFVPRGCDPRARAALTDFDGKTRVTWSDATLADVLAVDAG